MMIGSCLILLLFFMIEQVVTVSQGHETGITIGQLSTKFEEQQKLITRVENDIKLSINTLKAQLFQQLQTDFSASSSKQITLIGLVGKLQTTFEIQIAKIAKKVESIENTMLEIKTNLKEQASKPQPQPKTCPSGYIGNKYRCYKFGNVVGRPAAEAICKNGGGRLVTLQSKDEMLELMRLMKDNNIAPGWFYWLGGKRVNGQWMWEGINKPMAYTNWDRGHPRSDNGVDCVGLIYSRPTSNAHTKWQGYTCNYSFRVMCEKDY